MLTIPCRLRANVIKTGLRKISVSYSRISLVDVCKKLSLDTIDEAECIVAKARLAIRCDPAAAWKAVCASAARLPILWRPMFVVHAHTLHAQGTLARSHGYGRHCSALS